MATFDILVTLFQINKNGLYADDYYFLIGGFAGCLAVVMTYPTDLLRRTIQLSGQPGHPTYSGMLDAAVKIVR